MWNARSRHVGQIALVCLVLASCLETPPTKYTATVISDDRTSKRGPIALWRVEILVANPGNSAPGGCKVSAYDSSTLIADKTIDVDFFGERSLGTTMAIPARQKISRVDAKCHLYPIA